MGITEEERSRLSDAMDRHADGDGAAFAELYDLLAPRLMALFMRNVRVRARAEDLVQHTMMQLHAARHNYKRGTDVVPWAFAIARNAMIDVQRKTRRELLPNDPDDFDDEMLRLASRDSIPEDITQARQMAARVREALERLPESQRAAYELVRADGLSVAQAAETLGTTTTAIKLRLHRAYEALRAILER